MSYIGFVGLGHMGLPMAVNLIKAGHTVIGFDLNPQAMKAFTASGGQTATHLQQIAAEGKDTIITMLQTGEQVKSVCLGDNGLLAKMKAPLLMDCSSIDVQSSRQIHQQATQQHILAVDAPVSGGVAGAEAATLTFMVGGTAPAVQASKPFLEQMGKKIIHTGEAGSGQAAKICNNMILGISMIAISEAFTLGQKLGLEPHKLFEVVSNSSGQCWAMDRYVPLPGILGNVPADRGYQPGFSSAMMLKDLKLSQQSAASEKVKTPLGEQATALYEQLNQKGMGDLDFSAIIKLFNSSSQ